ncbi:hypothetical protein AB0F15_40790 [Amycolatopsis sp. NPDC026612]|uniref:hypothetical protein n=1 Tax=Amycolatopsis sp. NPDC026612 TaxID=3155466 RepID=UPI0033E8B061
MSNSADSTRPRAARTTAWLLGGALILVAAVFLWVAYGPAGADRRALETASEASRNQAGEAVGRLVTAAHEGALTDARINRAMGLSTAEVRSIRRLDSAIVVTAEVHAVTSGAFGTLSADPCYEYDITLPVRNESSINFHEIPSCQT